MSDDYSPTRMSVRVRSTFELANPIQELPPDTNVVVMSPNTLRKKEKEIDELLTNAKCEEGTSMDSIAKYIPSKSTLKQIEGEAAKKTIEKYKEIARSTKQSDEIAELEDRISQLLRDSSIMNNWEQDELSIARPTCSIAQIDVINEEPKHALTQQNSSKTYINIPSNEDILIVSAPTTGNLATDYSLSDEFSIVRDELNQAME